MRDETEWMELVTLGFNRLVGSDKKNIILACRELLGKDMIVHKDLYGDSHAGDRIIDHLANHF
jgi:UDP-N-acetylglucosamine 2-epimerase